MQILRLRRGNNNMNDIEDLLSELHFVSETSITAPEAPNIQIDTRALPPTDVENEEAPASTRTISVLSPEDFDTLQTQILNTMSSVPTQSEDISNTLAEYGFYGESNDDEEDELEEDEMEEEATIVDSNTQQEDTPEEDAVEQLTNTEGMLPVNSPTLLINETTARFSGTEWFNEIQKKRILIAGVGGIGSNLAFQIARMCPEAITMYDDDRVELVNMAGQLYRHSDVGQTKVNAIANMIREYTNTQTLYAISERFNGTGTDIMMCGFDNMEARRYFFNKWVEHLGSKSTTEERRNCLYMDGRLSIDTLQILCISGEDTYNIARYEKEFLFSDEEAEHTVCSMKQTTYLACIIGSLMVNLFTNWVANSLGPIIPYDLPFFTEYDAQNMIFRTER